MAITDGSRVRRFQSQPYTGLPQNGQKRTGCSRMPSLPSFKMALATVSMRTPFSTKKCRPAGNDIAVIMSLQQGSNDFSGSDNCAASRALELMSAHVFYHSAMM